MSTSVPRDELNAVMTQFNDHWPAEADCDAADVREYAAYVRRAALDPNWPNLTDAEREANLAHAAAMDAFVDRIEVTA